MRNIKITLLDTASTKIYLLNTSHYGGKNYTQGALFGSFACQRNFTLVTVTTNHVFVGAGQMFLNDQRKRSSRMLPDAGEIERRFVQVGKDYIYIKKKLSRSS